MPAQSSRHFRLQRCNLLRVERDEVADDLGGFDENPATASYFSSSTNQYLPHISVGCGARVTVSNYFVVSCDWAMPLKEQDNDRLMNLYFTVGYLF